jgi:hypothetical protein
MREVESFDAAGRGAFAAACGRSYELMSGATARPKRTYSQMPRTRRTAIAPHTMSRESGTGSSGGWSCGFVIASGLSVLVDAR